MSGAVSFPTIIRSVDTNIHTILSSAWARRQRTMWYERVVRRRKSETGIEFIQWLLETARIKPMNRGGRNVWSDMAAVNYSITNEEFGDELKLTEIEILNALGATQNGAGRNALDYAAHWSRQMGSQGAYWPQLKASGIMLSGTSAANAISAVTCYDGRPFFDLLHPVVPPQAGGPPGGPTFMNLFYGRPLNAQNYALICGYIESIPSPDNLPRKIKPKLVGCGTDNRLTANQMFGTKSTFFSDPLNPNGTAAASNITRELYDTSEPIIDADLNCTGQQQGTWWIAAELEEDDELAGIIYQERLPFRLRSYTDWSDVMLAREETFEWKFTGWNQIAAGHPFLLFQCRPDVPQGQVQWFPP